MLPLADATAHATVAVAIVTGVLALGTFVLALITYFGNIGARKAEAKQLQAAHDQLQAAQEQLNAAHDQLAASYRPVIVPFQLSGENIRFRGGTFLAGRGPHIEENTATRYSAAFLAVENVGTGPAVNVQGNFTGPRGSGTTQFPTEAIAAGARGVVVFENWDGDSLDYSGNDKSVSAVLKYEDVAGTTYRTDVTFDIGHNAYRSTIREPS